MDHGLSWEILTVLNVEERLGKLVTLAEIRDFRQCVGKCDLQDLKSSGAFFTWNNKQDGKVKVQSKIDRVLINSEWMNQMHAPEVHFMNEGLYDHSPAIIQWENDKGGGKRQFILQHVECNYRIQRKGQRKLEK